jgi:regulator of protease activity HflC (stomatin/prohibitin superfamily)
MDDSDKPSGGEGSAEGDAPGGETREAPASPPRPQQPIGGMVRDPREVKTNPSLTRFLRERMSAAFVSGLVAIGVLRPRTPTGELGPRSWKGLFAFLGTIFVFVFVWTSLHVVQPGTVAVPVTFGSSGEPLKPGFRVTLPFTATYSMSTRTQNYTMSALKGEGAQKNSDDSVAVLGRDGGSANVNATVLYRLDPKKATDVYRTIGRNYQTQIVRPSARNCIRIIFTHYDVVTAATSAWDKVEDDVSTCMKDKLIPRGLLLQDFQMREVTLAPTIRAAVNAKVTAQQTQEQQKFEQATALQQADITRIQALATADSQQILACGGVAQTIVRNGARVSTVVPNPLTACSQSQLTPAYLQFTYIQALKQLVASQSNTTLILPFDQNLTPLLNINGTGTTTPTTGG